VPGLELSPQPAAKIAAAKIRKELKAFMSANYACSCQRETDFYG